MKRFIISITILAVLTVSGVGVWLFLDQRAKAEQLESEILKGLSAEELILMLKSEATADLNAIKSLQDDGEKRKIFLQGLKETLALASQARREGFADDPNFKINFAYKKNILLADLYLMKLSTGKDRLYVVSPNEIDAVWKDANNEKLFQKDMKTLREVRVADEIAKGNQSNIPELQGESLANARNKWARTKILSDQAKKDTEFIKQPAIPLRFKLIEAGILSNDYLRANIKERLSAKPLEISQYLAEHPEYDVKNKLEKAEMLLKKVQAGEDFGKLAKETSEDRLSNEKGGRYEDIATNVVWKEVEDAALQLEPNEVADRIIETNFGYHIVKLVKKNHFKKEDRSDLKFTVQHIVLQKKFEDPQPRLPEIPVPYITAEEIAEIKIVDEKRRRFIDEILKKNPVTLPMDFKIELPEVPKQEPNGVEKNAE